MDKAAMVRYILSDGRLFGGQGESPIFYSLFDELAMLYIYIYIYIYGHTYIYIYIYINIY